VLDDRARLAQRLAKLIFERPSVVRSTPARARPSRMSPSICALRRSPSASSSRIAWQREASAIHAAYGMPAVSPPATTELLEPTSARERRDGEVNQIGCGGG